MALLKLGLNNSKKGFLERNKGKKEVLVLSRICDDLVSEKPQSAVSAVDQIAELGDAKMLLVALDYPSKSVQIRVARALRQRGDKTIVPGLLAILEKENVDHMKGGTETKLFNRELKSELVSAIVAHTGIKYEGSGKLTADELKNFMAGL